MLFRSKVSNSPEFYDEARTNGYLAAGAQFKWWKGKGGFIDYSNPDAMKWWHGLQQQVLDWGVDGWKLDGCDTFFSGRVGKLPVPFNRVHSGWMTTRQYMDHYARDEFQHGLTQNPEFVTLVRALDRPWSHPEGFAPLDAAPVTWVGDNQHTWKYEKRGIEGALSDILGSARLGYCVIGSDVAGYHGRSNPDDVGPATAARFSEVLRGAKTVLWNGPMGIFEDKRFATGTNAVAQAVVDATQQNGAKSIIGGGDSVKALNKAKLGDKVTFMSTGGGASLEFLEGAVLPGVAALTDQ